MPETTPEGDVKKLKTARAKIVDVYENQALDNLSDNGNLSSLHNAVLNINIAIKEIEKKT